VIVGTQQGGYLREVTSVQVDTNQLILETGDTWLTQIIQKGSFDTTIQLQGGSLNKTVSPQSLPRITKYVEGVELLDGGIDLSGVILYSSDLLEISIPDGEILFTPDFEMNLEINDWRLKEFRATATGTISAFADFQATASVSQNINREITLAEFEYGPNVVFIGYVPVVYTVTLGFIAGFEFASTHESTTQAGFRGSITATAGAQYHNSEWHSIWDKDAHFYSRPITCDIEGHIGLRGYIRPALEVTFYTVAGPYINIEPYLSFEGNYNLPNWSWQLDGGITGEIGFHVIILDHNLADYNAELLALQTRIASDSGVTQNSPPNQPSNPNPPDNSVDQLTSIDLSWTCSDPDGDPLTYNVHFGTTSPPPLVNSGQHQVIYEPGFLQTNTTYYWKIVADDGEFHTSGTIWHFLTESESNPYTDPRDGQIYSTVQIGDQTWMADNLNFNAGEGSGYYDGDSVNYADIYGRIYTASVACSSCPAGWHLPSYDEWVILANELGGNPVAGGKIKSIGTLEDSTGLWSSPNVGATNESGFSAIPFPPGHRVQYWSSTEVPWGGSYNAPYLYNNSSSFFVTGVYYDQMLYNSVRCIQDSGYDPGEPPDPPSNPSPPDNSTDQSVNTILYWSCTDPDGDQLLYDVYFGTSSSPLLVSSNQTETSYDPGQLNYNTQYYWKIVADDGEYETDGDIWRFTTAVEESTGTVTDIDGNVYQTVTIGTQVWMAENLKVTHYRNGDGIPNVTDNAAWETLASGAYCNYGNDISNVTVYGRLYNWYAVDDSRNMSPAGWHVPSDAEWQTLVDYLGGDAVAGGKMKEVGTTHWHSPNTGATNESGFSALPGGYRLASGSYYDMGYNATFWSSTEFSSSIAWFRYLYCGDSGVSRDSYDMRYGFSVRCVRD